MIVHPGSTNVVGLLAAVKAPVRRPDGTRNIKFTVAAFRPWRGSPASIASDPTFNAALRFAYPRHRLPGEFSPARAGCWCREPLPPRLARPNLSKKPKRRMIDCLPNHPAFVQKLESLYRVTAPCQPLPKCDQNQISLSGVVRCAPCPLGYDCADSAQDDGRTIRKFLEIVFAGHTAQDQDCFNAGFDTSNNVGVHAIANNDRLLALTAQCF